MKVVFLWELARRKWFVLWWTLGVSGLIAMTVLAYRAFGGQAKQLDQSFSGLTSSAGSFFGGSDFFSPIGYLSSQVYFILLPVLLIIMVTTLASSLMNHDENNATVELTLARAVSRRQLLAAKALAGFIVVAAVCLLSYLVTIASVKAANMQISGVHLFVTHVLSFAFSLSFGVISFALMAVSRLTRKIANVIAIVLAFGGYIITSLASFVHWLSTLAKFMPYHYYDTVALLSGHVQVGLLWYLAGVTVAGVVIAVAGYSRRDIA